MSDAGRDTTYLQYTPPVLPTLDQAWARVAALDPAAYARTRNALGGAVSGLSPYITHGLLSLPQVLAGVHQRHPMAVQHKFVYELGWREFGRHVWAQQGAGICRSLHPGPLPDEAYAPQLPPGIRQRGRSAEPKPGLKGPACACLSCRGSRPGCN